MTDALSEIRKHHTRFKRGLDHGDINYHPSSMFQPTHKDYADMIAQRSLKVTKREVKTEQQQVKEEGRY